MTTDRPRTLQWKKKEKKEKEKKPTGFRYDWRPLRRPEVESELQ